MKIPPCATGSHSAEPAAETNGQAAGVKVDSVAVPTSAASSKETLGTAKPVTSDLQFKSANALPMPKPTTTKDESQDPPQKPQSTEYVEVQDDPDATVEKGTRCKRKACGLEYEGGDRSDGECNYHPGVVSFRPCSRRGASLPRLTFSILTAHLCA